MTSSSGSSIEMTHSGSSSIFVNDLRSSTWRCIPRRPGSSSSDGSPPNAGGHGDSVSLRRSTTLASRISAGRRGTGASSSSASRSRIGCGRSSERSRTSSDCVGIYPSPSKGDGWQASCEAISPTTPCQATAERSEHSEIRRPGIGSSRFDAEASAIVWTGIECTALRLDGCRRSASCIPTLTCASTPGPEAGAQCGSAARWDLCGGLAVTGLVRPRPVPTATLRRSLSGSGRRSRRCPGPARRGRTTPR